MLNDLIKTASVVVLASVFLLTFPSTLLAQQSAQEYFNLAVEARKRGKIDEAIKMLDEAIRLNTNFIEALFARSDARRNNQRDLEGAMKDIETILQLDPSNGKAFFWRAQLRNSLILQRLKKNGPTPGTELMPFYREILEDVNLAITNGFENTLSLRYRAGLLTRHFRKYPEAIEDYTAALAIDPSDTSLYLSRSEARRRNDDLNGAADDLREIVSVYEEAAANPADKKKLEGLKTEAVIALNNLSSIFALLERPDDQLWAIQKSLEIEPNPSAYAARARHHMIFGELRDSVADYTTAIELSGNDSRKSWYLMSRGIVFILDNQPEKAEADFAEGRKNPRMKRYNLKYRLEVSRRQRDQRRVKVELPR